MNIQRIVFLLTALLMIQWTGARAAPRPTPVEATPQLQTAMQASEKLCFALDLVFVIDQSASMSGNTPNDPLEQRIEAPRYAIDWLANNHLGACPDAVHRIGVVSFGTEASVDLEMLTIEPETQTDWESILSTARQQLTARDMQATNPILGIQQAVELLNGIPALDGELRKRAIVLLTDGQPCVPGVGCSFQPLDPVNQRYIQDMINYVDTSLSFSEVLLRQEEALRQAAQMYGGLSAIPQNEINDIFAQYLVTPEERYESTYFYIIAMNSTDPYLDAVGDQFRQIATTHGGELVDLEQNLLEVPREFNRIMSWLAGVTPIIGGCGNLPVDPYLSGAILDIYKVARGLEVEIRLDEKMLKAGQGDSEYFGVKQYTEFGAVEHYRFRQPPAGLWQISATACDQIESSFQPFRATVEQVEPTDVVPLYNLDGQTSDPLHPYYISYRITDTESGMTLDENPNYPLNVQATVTDPNGKETVLEMEFETEGEWISKDPLPVDVVGDYTVKMTAKAPCVEDPDAPGRCPEPEFLVAEHNQGKYSTKEVEPFSVKILAPVDGAELPLHGPLFPDGLEVTPIDYRVQVIDKKGNPLHYPSVLIGDPSEALQATVEVMVEGQTERVPITFTVDPGDPSILQGTTLEPQVTETHTFIVELDASKYDHHKYIPYGLPVQVSFTRSDGLLRNPKFYVALGWIFGLTALAALILILLCHRNAVRGQLKLTRDQENKSIPLYNGWCSVTKKSSKCPPLVALGFQWIKVKNMPPNGRSARIEVIAKTKAGTKTYNLTDATNGVGSTYSIEGWVVSYFGEGPVGRPQQQRRPQQKPRPVQPQRPGARKIH